MSRLKDSLSGLNDSQLLGALKGNKFLSDLYRDLRERHLLPVVILLVVAIAAVPIVLRSEPESSSPPPPADVVDDEATAAMPAVLVDDPGVRNYQERLEALESKNPFEAKFSLPSAGASAVEDVSVDSAGGSGEDTSVPADTSFSAGGSTSTGSTDLASGSTSVGSSAPADTSSPPAAEPSSPVDDSSGDGEEPPEQEWFAYEHWIDVVVGRAGEAEPQEDVKPLSLLPGKSSPVLIYFGANVQADTAVFSVSSDVVSSSGDGTCLPSAKVCEFLQLGIGEQRTLEYAPDGPGGGRFVIRLKDIHREVVDKIEGNPFEDEEKSADRDKAPSDLSAWLGLGG
jgi:hypothetical protein